jgi:DNA polymerase
VTQSLGKFLDSRLAPYVTATVHPSSILRAPDDATRHAETDKFVQDLRVVAKALRSARTA